MNIPSECKIEAAASKDETRWALKHVELETVEGKSAVVATDGCILAFVPVTVGEGETSGPVTADALKVARKARKANNGSTVVHCNESLAVPNGPTFPRPTKADTGDFPNWRNVTPKYAEGETLKFTIDVDLLCRLASALGCEGKCMAGVQLEVSTTNRHAPITVRPGALQLNDGRFGYLMPVRNDTDSPDKLDAERKARGTK